MKRKDVTEYLLNFIYLIDELISDVSKYKTESISDNKFCSTLIYVAQEIQHYVDEMFAEFDYYVLQKTGMKLIMNGNHTSAPEEICQACDYLPGCDLSSVEECKSDQLHENAADTESDSPDSGESKESQAADAELEERKRSIKDHIEQLTDQLKTLLLKKNRAYGSSVEHRPVLAPWISPEDALLVRTSDKIERITNLSVYHNYKECDDMGETLDDTFMDLAGYCILRMALSRLGSDFDDEENNM